MKKPSRSLLKVWREKLASSGFTDIEDDKGRLKGHNRRTALFETRDATKGFYELLDAFLNSKQELTRLDRKILELYSQGRHLNDIGHEVYRSLAFVKNVVYRYRDIILKK